MTELSDDDKKRLYTSLLRGLANTAQDQLCAADRQHAWGKWERYIIKPDMPSQLSPPSDEPIAMDETFQTGARRSCLNCGKEQFA